MTPKTDREREAVSEGRAALAALLRESLNANGIELWRKGCIQQPEADLLSLVDSLVARKIGVLDPQPDPAIRELREAASEKLDALEAAVRHYEHEEDWFAIEDALAALRDAGKEPE